MPAEVSAEVSAWGPALFSPYAALLKSVCPSAFL